MTATRHQHGNKLMWWNHHEGHNTTCEPTWNEEFECVSYSTCSQLGSFEHVVIATPNRFCRVPDMVLESHKNAEGFGASVQSLLNKVEEASNGPLKQALEGSKGAGNAATTPASAGIQAKAGAPPQPMPARTQCSPDWDGTVVKTTNKHVNFAPVALDEFEASHE